MAKEDPQPCARCERLQQRCQELEEQLQQAQQTIQLLHKQLAIKRKDSTTSSKPPSSDIVKPPKAPPSDDTNPRTPGGQPGHPPHFRPPFPPDQVTATHSHRLTHCPECQQPLQDTPQPPQVVQQIDLNVLTFTIEEHHSHTSWCPRCQKAFAAPLPERIAKGGLLGPQLTALVAYLKGACHASFSTIRKFFRDVLQVPISRGYLAKVIQKVSAALKQPYEELLAQLPDQDIINADETGHMLNGARWWTWCFRAELFTLYHIDAHRSADVLMKVLGRDFDGVLGCDCFSAYRRYMRECNIVVQFCLAHLIRDVKFLTTLPGREDKAYGERLREELRRLFHLIHERDQYAAKDYQRRLEAQRQQIVRCGTCDVPKGRHCQAMAKRLEKYGASYFTFLTTPEVEPTNNLAEQAIRFVVIDRHITQGTRSEGGNRWSERIWTVLATCAMTGQSVFEFLQASVQAYWEGTAPPSLLGT
ncbi:MAG TPA: IS66 family transposase [Alphaproteobacteria bacterium]|nr:IS66 family transposase [Alphaproteobacteria bacterium]